MRVGVGQQGLVVALLDDAAAIEHEDPVGGLDGGEAVGFLM